MTPYQIGFLASRIMAVVCTVWAGGNVPWIVWYFEQSVPMEAAAKLSVLAPFIVEALLALALWTGARAFAGAFAAIQASEDRTAPQGDLAAALFRVLGAYFVIGSAPGMVSSLARLIFPPDTQNTPIHLLLNLSRERPLAAEAFYFCAGLVVMIGARRLCRAVLVLPTKFMAATSLPEVDPPEEPPAG